MGRKISILRYLPEIHQSLREFQQIAWTEDTEFKQMERENAQDLDDAFILTAGEKSIGIWEKEIGIRADPSVEDIEFRRKRLINRYTTKPPFTIKWLERQLKELLEDGFIRCERDDDVEILRIYAELLSLPLLREFDSSLEAVLPLSMQYEKQLRAKREAREQAYAAMASYGHLHLVCSTR